MADLEILNPLPCWAVPMAPIAYPLIIWCSRKKYFQHRDDFLWVTLRLIVDDVSYSGPISTYLDGPSKTQDRIDIRERIALPLTGPPNWDNSMFFKPAATGHVFKIVVNLWIQRLDNKSGNDGGPTHRAPELMDTCESNPIGVREVAPNKPLLEFRISAEEKSSRDGKVKHVWELLQLQRSGQPIPENWLPKSEREAGSFLYETNEVNSGTSSASPSFILSQLQFANDLNDDSRMRPERSQYDTSNYDANHGLRDDWSPKTKNPGPWNPHTSQRHFLDWPESPEDYALDDDDKSASEGWSPSYHSIRQEAPFQSGQSHSPCYGFETPAPFLNGLENVMDDYSPFYESSGSRFSQTSPTFSQPRSSFSQPRSKLSQPRSDFSQPSQPRPEFSQPSSELPHPRSEFSQPRPELSQTSPEFSPQGPHAGNQFHSQRSSSRLPNRNSGRHSNVAEHNARYGFPPVRHNNAQHDYDDDRPRNRPHQRSSGGNHGRSSSIVSYRNAYSMTPPNGFTDPRERENDDDQTARLNARFNRRRRAYANGYGEDTNDFM